MTPTEILTAARAKIAQGWVQCFSAIDHSGAMVNPDSHKAVAWCTVGAVEATTPWGSARLMSLKLLAIAAEIGEGFIMDWNDNRHRTQAQVLKMFDDAIELSKLQPN